VLIVADGQLLVVKSWLGTGQWGLPGGGLHRGEDPVVGAQREVREETGLTLKSSQLEELLRGRTKRHGLGFNYICYLTYLPNQPSLKKQHLEITDIVWLKLKDLQPADLTEDARVALAALQSVPGFVKL
jgi:8-oxo-dGTP pyrophosphatase MutT (NUDIX family)